jgi:diguanylate cyclase (GGDEF)-like protein
MPVLHYRTNMITYHECYNYSCIYGQIPQNMIIISGYRILTQIYESINSEVYRAIRESDGQRVILKVLKQDYPTPAELTRYKQEYELTRTLNLEGVIKAYGLEKYKNTLVIILEDFGGESLKILRENQQFSLGEFLSIAIEIARILGELHAAHIIHKDINPANIVINPKTGQLKIIDLGISTRLTREKPTLKNPNVLEGTLPYISPEQTGRMNRFLDYRTDFYSLGVTFYEVLTNQLPFETDDNLELVHFHLAKTPVLPAEINPLIPPVFSNIVMKLMAKNAEDRYQSAWGLKADLEKCLSLLELTGNIADFTLGSKDISDKFQIPQKLYGRESEIETLITAFERVSDPPPATGRGGELMLIAGYSGIGKSAIVQEIYKPITEKRGYFIAGKFDQFQRNIPYGAIGQAFQQFVKQLLTENSAHINLWKTKFLAALGGNGQVIIDVISEVELIIGKQSPVPELGPTASQNRFNLVCQNFLRACCAKEHPLVIFLDDLQWADGATLKLIELMMTDRNLPYLFLIGAYRDNEVSIGHPLMIMLDDFRKSEVIIHQITLSNLGLEDIMRMLADTLKSDRARVQLLGELVLKKTGGNPFFVKQFLKLLYTEHLIDFAYDEQIWEWDQARIEAQDITDNVVELMIGKLKKLPKATQSILQLAACIGANFDLHTLSVIGKTTPSEIFTNLMPAIDSGLILPLSELDEQLLIQNYQFLHDRVEQAAYSLIPEEQKKATHLQIGQLLQENSSEMEKEEKLFDIVGHFNLGIELITQTDQREALAKLNLKAGRKAKNATAYAAAKNYLQTGILLLAPNCWQTQYELALNLYVAAAESAYLNGDFNGGMDDKVEPVLENAQTILDKVKIYEILMAVYTAQSKTLDAIAVGRKALEELGVEFDLEPDEAKIKKAIQILTSQLCSRGIEELVDLPVMSDRKTQAAMQLLGMLIGPVFMGKPGLLPLLSSTMVSLSLQFGNAPASGAGYMIHGTVLCAFFGYVKTGYNFGKLALNLLERFNTIEFKAIIMDLFGSCLQHHQESLRSAIPMLKDGYKTGMETGDFLWGSFCILNYGIINFLGGVEVDNFASEIDSYSAIMAQLQQYSTQAYLDMIRQTIHNLKNPVSQPDHLIGTAYDETVMIPQYHRDNQQSAMAGVYVFKLLLAYFFGNYTAAKEYITQANQYLIALSGMIFVPIFHFYAALTHLALFPTELEQEGRHGGTAPTIMAQIENHQTILHQWAQNAPMNHLHKWHLVEAEKNRVLGNKAEAIEHYDRAISGAKENQFLNEESLANELAAKFYLNWGKEKIAQDYMQSAHYAYTLWGATAKVKDLEQKYPQLLTFTSTTPIIKWITNPRTSTGIDSGTTLDLATLLKASQAISGEIFLDKLLVSLMKIIIENAGGQQGYLVLETNGKLLIEASGVVDDDNITALESIPIENHLPVTLINYVARLKEYVVLNDATRGGNFVNDPYILINKPLSILCYPLLNQGKLVGIVYLENNLMTAAFTTDRIELLQLLSGQAAISVTNAILYAEKEEYAHTLEQKVRDRTAELQQANQELLRLANVDGLTKVANRRCFDDYLRLEWKRHLREQQPLGLIMIDIDYFKRYNDYYGHQGGDDCLIRVAQAIAKSPQRATDLVARYGGEEFVVVLPNTHAENALIVAEKIRSAIAFLSIPHATSQVSQYVTLSLGVASLIPTPKSSPEDLMAQADQALYTAKNEGRDRAIKL